MKITLKMVWPVLHVVVPAHSQSIRHLIQVAFVSAKARVHSVATYMKTKSELSPKFFLKKY